MDFSTILLIVLILVVIALIVLVVLLNKKTRNLSDRLDLLLTGREGEDIEASIQDKFKRLQILEEKDNAEDKAIRDLYKKLKGAYQKIGIEKYDAYMENGGKLSFAMAFLNEENTGMIINVMNGTDGSYCYIKEVENGQCDIALGREEAKALENAVNK